MKPSTIPNANLGVFATTFIPKNTWLGEYEGDIVPSTLLEKDLLEYAWNVSNVLSSNVYLITALIYFS